MGNKFVVPFEDFEGSGSKLTVHYDGNPIDHGLVWCSGAVVNVSLRDSRAEDLRTGIRIDLPSDLKWLEFRCDEEFDGDATASLINDSSTVEIKWDLLSGGEGFKYWAVLEVTSASDDEPALNSSEAFFKRFSRGNSRTADTRFEIATSFVSPGAIFGLSILFLIMAFFAGIFSSEFYKNREFRRHDLYASQIKEGQVDSDSDIEYLFRTEFPEGGGPSSYLVLDQIDPGVFQAIDGTSEVIELDLDQRVTLSNLNDNIEFKSASILSERPSAWIIFYVCMSVLLGIVSLGLVLIVLSAPFEIRNAILIANAMDKR